MGILVQGKELWRALFTRTRRRVLTLLFGHPDRTFYANEIVRLAGVGTGSVQRELERLSDAGLLTVTRIGNQRHFQANRESPFFDELHSMVVKTFGALSVLRDAVRELPRAPQLALLYGESMDAPEQPLSLLLVSDVLTRERIGPTLEEAAARVGRELRLVLLRPERFQRLLDEGDAELAAVLAQPRLVLLGEVPESAPETTGAWTGPA